MHQAPIEKFVSAGEGDAELVRRALAREEAAVRAIMQANNRRLYRLARGILRNDAEAEDVVQDTYVRAFTHLEHFRGDSSLSTWLSRIAMNEALGRLRRLLPDHVCEPLNVHALLPARQFVPAKVRCFLDALEAHAHDGPAVRADQWPG